MGRWVAKNVVAAGLATKCEVQFAYAIGHPLPVSVHVDTFGTGTKSDAAILAAILQVFSFKPADIVKQLTCCGPFIQSPPTTVTSVKTMRISLGKRLTKPTS